MAFTVSFLMQRIYETNARGELRHFSRNDRQVTLLSHIYSYVCWNFNEMNPV